jgi:MFS family permease
MYVVSVVLPAVQAEFGVARAEASMPYTLLMVGFGWAAWWMGKLADRHGVVPVAAAGRGRPGPGVRGLRPGGGITGLRWRMGCCWASSAASATFAPLVADTSLWFVKRRGIAVAVCASGNYLAGAIWPPVVQHFVDSVGWRPTCIGLGIFSVVTLPALAQRHARQVARGGQCAGQGRAAGAVPSDRPFGLSWPRPWAAVRGRRRPAAWRWPCRRCTSWPTAATAATARRAAPRC